MNGTLIAALRNEEQAILEELHSSRSYRRLQRLRELLDMYDAQPPVGAALDAMLADGRSQATGRNAARQAAILLRAEARSSEVA